MSYQYKKKVPNNGQNLKTRLLENYDIILITLGGVLLLGFLGYPITKETTTHTVNPNFLQP